MLRGSRRITIVSIAFLVLTAGANSQLRAKPRAGTVQPSAESRGETVQTSAAPAQPTNPNGQHRSFQAAMKETVNPTNRDYGLIFNGWQDTMVRYTIESFIWWASVVSLILLIAGGVFFWWYVEMWGKRQACFERAAAVLIGQRNTAIEHARFAILKHNVLVDILDQLQADNAGADQADAPGVLVADQAAAAAQEDGEATDSMVVVLEDAGSVEKQVIPGEAAAIYKIGTEEFIKKEDAARQLAAEKQRSTRLSAKVKQQQDLLFKYEK